MGPSMEGRINFQIGDTAYISQINMPSVIDPPSVTSETDDTGEVCARPRLSFGA